MKRVTLFCAILIVAHFAVGCNNQIAPTEPTPAQPRLALAKATGSPVSGTLWATKILDPGVTWLTPSGTKHRKGMVIEYAFAGDLQGTGTFEQHSDWTEGAVAGHAQGPLVANLEWQGITGTFTGEFAGNIDERFVRATLAAQGSGGFEGMKWQVTVEGFLSGVFTYSGRILDPKGE